MNYRLQFSRNQDPEWQKLRLSVVYDVDQVDAANQDVAFSPDNLDVVARQEFIQEDGTGNSRPEMENRNRDGSVWSVDGAFTSKRPDQFPPRLWIAELVGRTEGGATTSAAPTSGSRAASSTSPNPLVAGTPASG